MYKIIYLHLYRCVCRLFIGALLVIPFSVSAQTLSLYDAVDKAITNYPLLQARGEEIAAGRAHVTSVYDNRLPSLMLSDQVTSGTNNAVNGSYFPLGIVPSTSGGITGTNNNTASAGNLSIGYLQWQFYNFGYYNAQKKEANAGLAVAQSKLNSDKYTITQQVISLYLDWLKKYRLLQIENENVERSVTILDAIRATVLGGLKPGVDSSTAIASYADARIAYLKAADDYNIDKISLATYTALKPGNINPDTSVIQKALNNAEYGQLTTDSVSISHPLLDVYKKQYEQQMAANNVVAKKYLPKVGLDGAYWMRGSSISSTDAYADNLANGLPYTRYNYLMGLTLSYNLFDLRHRHDELSEGRHLSKEKENELRMQELYLNQLLQQANSSFATVLEKLKTLPAQLTAAQQAFTQQATLYSGGLNTLIDVTNAQYVLRQSETNYVIAQDELLQLLYIKEGLNNELETFLQNLK